MQARDVMTRDVATLSPESSTREIARLLVERGISAAPVVDGSGAPIGIVSEGDLLGRDDADREARRDWWLTLLAEGETLHPDFLASIVEREKTARDVMSAPLITIAEETEITEIARLLATYRIKRLPVLREGRITGVVSRADLVRALAAAVPGGAEHRTPRANPFARLDAAFLHRQEAGTPKVAPPPRPAPSPATVERFRGLVHAFAQQRAERREQARRAAAERRHEQVDALIGQHLSDTQWQALLQRAQAAAEQGAEEFLLLRFPSDLCTDGARAINAPAPDWPQTLRGEAAEIYLRFERDLKPHGFRLAARVLDFPGGVPGDVGLFLVWGE